MSEEKEQAMDGFDRMANKIKSLESRLEKANNEIAHLKQNPCRCEELESRLKEANDLIWNNKENLRQTNIGWTKTVESLRRRLSQAEAEVEAQKQMSKCSWDNDWQQTEIRSLKARLSHLMDVLNRLDIECQGTACDCGSKLKDWDIAVIVANALRGG